MFKVRKSTIIISIAAFILAVFGGGNIPWLILYMTFGAYLISFLWCNYVFKQLSCFQKTENKDYYVDDNITIQSYIDNDTLLFVPHVEVHDTTIGKISDETCSITVFNLTPTEREIVNSSAKAKYRGIYEVGPLEVTVSDIFGIFTFKRNIYSDTAFKIYPRIYDIENFNLKSMQSYGTMSTKQKAYEDNINVSDIRKYYPGDSVKKIHWKISAKMGSFFVKNYEMTGSASVYIFLDFRDNCYRGDSFRLIEEAAIETVSSIVSYFLKNQVSIDLYVNAQKLYYTKGRDIKEINSFMEILCEIKTGGNRSIEDVFEKRIKLISKGSSIILVTGIINDNDADKYSEIKHMGYDLVIIYVSDDRLDEKIYSIIKNSDIKLYWINSTSDIKGVLSHE